MKITLIILGLLGLIFLIKSCIPAADKTNDVNVKTVTSALPVKIDNDKIVVIKGANYSDIKKAVQQFCKLYNKQDFAAIPNLTKVSENEFVITFPYDITFDVFCFFVNYMYYPNDIFYTADIKAWATTKRGDIWVTDKSANKKVMLFIPADDQERDNVFLTTQDNIGYMLGFASGEETKLLDSPKQKFIPQTKTLESIKGLTSEEIK